jgi:hypothetical protein
LLTTPVFAAHSLTAPAFAAHSLITSAFFHKPRSCTKCVRVSLSYGLRRMSSDRIEVYYHPSPHVARSSHNGSSHISPILHSSRNSSPHIAPIRQSSQYPHSPVLTLSPFLTQLQSSHCPHSSHNLSPHITQSSHNPSPHITPVLHNPSPHTTPVLTSPQSLHNPVLTPPSPHTIQSGTRRS